MYGLNNDKIRGNARVMESPIKAINITALESDLNDPLVIDSEGVIRFHLYERIEKDEFGNDFILKAGNLLQPKKVSPHAVISTKIPYINIDVVLNYRYIHSPEVRKVKNNAGFIKIHLVQTTSMEYEVKPGHFEYAEKEAK